MYFETISTYEQIEHPVRLRILRRPDAGLAHYRSPSIGRYLRNASSTDEQLAFIGEHFSQWMRMNQRAESDIRRVTIYYSDRSDRDRVWHFGGDLFSADDFVFELVRAEGLPAGVRVEMMAVVRKQV